MKKIALVSVIDDDQFFQYSTRKIVEATNMVENLIEFPDGEIALEYFLIYCQHIQERVDNHLYFNIFGWQI
jgi:hypothetical protein